MPAVPEVTFDPGETVSVCPPIESAPSVWVRPTLAVVRSLRRPESAVTVRFAAGDEVAKFVAELRRAESTPPARVTLEVFWFPSAVAFPSSSTPDGRFHEPAKSLAPPSLTLPGPPMPITVDDEPPVMSFVPLPTRNTSLTSSVARVTAVAAASMVTLPLLVAVPPVPASVPFCSSEIWRSSVMPAFTWRIVPPETVVTEAVEPSALAFPTRRVPAETRVPVVLVLKPVSSNVPSPSLIVPPVMLRALSMVAVTPLATVMVFPLARARVPPLSV